MEEDLVSQLAVEVQRRIDAEAEANKLREHVVRKSSAVNELNEEVEYKPWRRR